MPEGEGRWLPVGVDDLSVDDRVRVRSRRTGAEYEGVVTTTLDSEGAVRVRHASSHWGGEYFHARYRTFERWTPYEVESTEPVPAAPAEEPPGWVSVTDFSTLRVGDIVRATPNGIGGRMQARVTGVEPFREDGYTAFTTHVITPSRNGVQRDRTCFGPGGYAYGDGGHDTEVWRGAMPAPAPVAQRETAIPEWATSLDAARRYVHAQAIELWRSDRNCWDGTEDFLNAADLPADEEWPEPDESAEIRAFLLKVREAALGTAHDHGKSVLQVEEWLTSHGITAPAPPPVRRTITVEVPAEVTEEQFRSEVIAFAAGPERPARNWRVV